MGDTLHVKVTGPLATLTLSRADVHNAIDELLAVNLTQAFQKLGVAEAVRVIVLEGEGEMFTAGADLGWLRRMAAMEPAEACRHSMIQAVMLDAIRRCPKPVIAMVRGPALGLGLAMVACADMAVAAEGASFAMTEIRLGMVPAVSAPYIAAAIGAGACRRYALTGERFDAREASRLGLIQAIIAADRLDAARDHLVEACLRGAPAAQAATKDLLGLVADTPMGPDLLRLIAARQGQALTGDEARSGLDDAVSGHRPEW